MKFYEGVVIGRVLGSSGQGGTCVRMYVLTGFAVEVCTTGLARVRALLQGAPEAQRLYGIESDI